LRCKRQYCVHPGTYVVDLNAPGVDIRVQSEGTFQEKRGNKRKGKRFLKRGSSGEAIERRTFRVGGRVDCEG